MRQTAVDNLALCQSR